MPILVDFGRPYQCWEVFYVGDTSYGAIDRGDYFAPKEHERISWFDKRDIDKVLTGSRRFISRDLGRWYIIAPNSIPDDVIVKFIRRIASGDTATVNWES